MVSNSSGIIISLAYGMFFLLRGLGIYNKTKFGMLIFLSFVLMALFPYIFFVKDGRRQIGLKKSIHLKWYWISALGGVLGAVIIFLIGFVLFGTSSDNWYISIIDQVMGEEERMIFSPFSLFLIVTLPSILFSPIGEELFFRGVIMTQFKRGDKKSKGSQFLTDVLPFALIHILHHGVFIVGQPYNFQIISGVMWFFLMIMISSFLAYIKNASKSLYPTILGHATFNLAMDITIFFFLI